MPKILLKPKRETSLDKYHGKWVAFVDDKVIAADKTLEDLMLKVKKMGLEKTAAVFLVPRNDEGPYVLK